MKKKTGIVKDACFYKGKILIDTVLLPFTT